MTSLTENPTPVILAELADDGVMLLTLNRPERHNAWTLEMELLYNELFDPTSNLSIRLTAFAQNLNTGGNNTFEIDPDTLKSLYGGFVQSRYQREPTHIKYRAYYGNADWDLGFANFSSITSYSTFDENLETDASFTNVGGGLTFAQLVNALANLGPAAPGVLGLPAITDTPITRPLGVELFQTTGTNKFTQEFRLAHNSHDFNWVVGTFYLHETLRQDQPLREARRSAHVGYTNYRTTGQPRVTHAQAVEIAGAQGN